MMDGIRIELSESMKPDAWISFDAKGEVTDVSAPGLGAQLSDKADVTVKMVCGRAVYDELMGMAQAVACDCWKCHAARGENPRDMVVCASCGNKRCPKASDHALFCTGSNDPGQPGSLYFGLGQPH